MNKESSSDLARKAVRFEMRSVPAGVLTSQPRTLLEMANSIIETMSGCLEASDRLNSAISQDRSMPMDNSVSPPTDLNNLYYLLCHLDTETSSLRSKLNALVQQVL